MTEKVMKTSVRDPGKQATNPEPCADSDSSEQIKSAKQIASWLAANFSSLRKRQKRLKTLKEFGPMKYTEDMAIADLTSISVNTGSDKVQTSSISKIPERVALLLSSGYVEKMQEKMNLEYEDLCSELEYVSWQLDIIDAAMEERMTERQRVIFRWVYLEKMSLRYIHDNLMPEISLGTIKAEQDNAVQCLAEEVEIRKAIADEENYFLQLTREIEGGDKAFEPGQGTGFRRTIQRSRCNTKAKTRKTKKASACYAG